MTQQVALETELKEMLVRELKLEDVDPAGILDAVELVVLMQKHYQVEIKDMEEGRAAFVSVEALANYIREKRPASD